MGRYYKVVQHLKKTVDLPSGRLLGHARKGLKALEKRGAYLNKWGPKTGRRSKRLEEGVKRGEILIRETKKGGEKERR